MTNPRRTIETLSKSSIHDQWRSSHLDTSSEDFHTLAFDEIVRYFDAAKGPVVDAGCGQGVKSKALLERGFDVEAVDFAPVVLDQARKLLGEYDDRVRFGTVDLTDMPYPSASVPQLLCWGVLMHIPQVDAAVKELARVLAPGGMLIVSESNRASIDSVLYRSMKRLMRRPDPQFVRTPAGVEAWAKEADGDLMTRHTDIGWLVRSFRNHGLELVKRRPGELTEMYTRVSGWKRDLIRRVNELWFRLSLPATASFGNILVLTKPR